MAKIKNSISSLVETQLPEFISTEYELFGEFLTKYYESLEISGGTLDIANNLQTYLDIGHYESNLLKQNSELVSNITSSDTEIEVADATSFPEKNGYIKIDDEICFYKTRTDTVFEEVSRGVSGNTKLGDLYSSTEFVTTQADNHLGGSQVQNISNLFLYALVKNFESTYLASFPEKYLKNAVDKRTLIKNIGEFYRSKGTEKSIQFLFNTVVEGGVENKPTVYNPSDFTYKSSTSDWTQGYALRVKVLEGDVNSLIGQVITQQEGPRNGFASATVDNVRFDSTVDGEDTYNLFLATETLNGIFEFTAKTQLTKAVTDADGVGDRINVVSTLGWADSGSLLIGNEIITFTDKNVTQFTIASRQQNAAYTADTDVYDPIFITSGDVKLVVFGLTYNLLPTNPQPYSSVGDRIEVTNPGFETVDPKIVTSQGVRWLLTRPNDVPTSPTDPSYTSSLANLSTDVSAVFSDEQFYYITTSGYPSYPILENVTSIPGNLADQKILKLIRKEAISTTEIYKTPNTDVGILVNGVRIYSYKDDQIVNFGKLEEINVQNQGTNYKNAPFVLVNGVSGRAVSKLSGQFVESVEILEEGLYGKVPSVEITSGRGAEISATITFGEVTDLIIDNPGEYYSTPPVIVITDLAGQGRLADYRALISDGKIVGFEEVSKGSFYTQDNVRVTVLPVGSGAVATPKITQWVKNRYDRYSNTLDDNNGFVFENFNKSLEYGYAHIANPKSLRAELGDNLSSLGVEPATKTHSPILGFAYDGNPIYGPFAYQNPLDPQSSVVRMTSSYILKSGRAFGPSVANYPLGSFIQDYEYRHKLGSLDQNNGRFCVTPDYPEGTYAYFMTIDSQQVPQFPYIVGDNFYSLPVESNYASDINQTNISKNVKRLYVPGLPQNGGGVVAVVQDLESGSVDSIDVESSSASFNVGTNLVFDNSNTEGNGVEAKVSTVTGKSVNYLESFESRAVKLVITKDSYVFANDFLRQPGSGAFGTIVGDVRADKTILVRDVNGTFDNSATFSTDIKVVRLAIDKVSSFAQGSTLELTDGVVTTAATGEVLESVSAGNTVILKVLSGTFEDQDTLPGYFLKSSSLSDTSGARVDSIEYLSDGLVPFDIDNNIALVETSEEHNLAIGDVVNVSINPDDTVKTRTYQVRKRIYQELSLVKPEYPTTVNYSGIGRGIILNAGLLYDVGSYTNVPLTGGSGENATANIVVSPVEEGDVTGYISDVQISDGGTGYKRGDVLGVDDASLGKVPGSSPQTLRFFIDHVGVSDVATVIKVKSAVDYAENDILKIDDELVKIVSLVNNQVQGGTLTVERGQLGTKAVDHYDNAPVSLYDGGYNFDSDFTVNGSESVTYDKANQKLLIVYPSTQSLSTLQGITEQTTFFDDSVPQRFVKIVTATAPLNRYEFRLDPSLSIFGTNAPNDYTSEWNVNPIIEVQEYYKYRFDTSDNSLTGSHLDFSPSGNYNISPIEKKESVELQGSPNSFVEMKFGFGAVTAQNQYDTPVQSRFANFYYFDRNNTITSDGSYLALVQDPLAGRQVLNYVTPTRFSYSLTKNPQWDGSGNISYTTDGQFAIGAIDTVSVLNIGANYKKTPIVVGAYLNEEYEATATVLFDSVTNTISGAEIVTVGQNYSKPKVVVEGDGEGAAFDVVTSGGQIFDVIVTNPGRGYTKAPTIRIIESDVKLFAQGNRIGRPKNVKIVQNGSSFHKDNSLLSEYSNSYVFAVFGYGEKNFLLGERVTQTVNGTVVAFGEVREWRPGSNLLKISKINGKFRSDVPIVSKVSKITATIKNTYVSLFNADLRPYSDNTGDFRSDRGRLGVSNQRLIDSFFYQDYSYVVKSRTSIDSWRELVKETTHPAGFKLFGEVIIDPIVEDGITMPEKMPKASHFSIIQLSDKVSIESESTRRTVTQSIITTDDLRAVRGTGSVDVSDFNFSETISQTLTLREEIDGVRGTDLLSTGNVAVTAEYGPGDTFEYLRADGTVVSKTVQQPHIWKFYAIEMLDNSYGVDLTNDLSLWPTSSYIDSATNITGIRSFLTGYGLENNDGSIVSVDGDGTINYNNQSDPPSAFYGDRLFIIDTPAGRAFVIKYEYEGQNQFEEAFNENWRLGEKFRLYVDGLAGDREYGGWIDFRISNIYYNGVESASLSDFGVGKVIGRNTFTLESSPNSSVFPHSAENLVVTIDGVIQEPGVAYTVNGSQITFAEAPLGATVVEGQDIPEQKIFIRHIEFKDNASNDKHFRKIRNFYQRNGRWLDAANQILLNVDFIVAESIGYFENKYADQIANATIPWTAIEAGVQADIRELCSALEHDLRFGGNVKVVNYANEFAESYARQKDQINDLFQYVIRLAKLAVRNWDYIALGCEYAAGGDIIVVPDTSNIAVGAVVSSGQALPLSSNIRVTEIISDTQVRISSTALTSSSVAPAGSAGPGTTYLSGEQVGDLSLETATGAVIPPNEYSLPPGTSLTAPPVFAGLDQVTFTFSGLNNGTFYDASNLISKNRDYIIDYALNWGAEQFPNLDWGDTKRINANINVNNRIYLTDETDITNKGDGFEIEPDVVVVESSTDPALVGNSIGTGSTIIPRLEYKGYIKSVDILDGGSGYTQPPIVSFPGDMENIYAVAQISAGEVTDILISGTGFSTTTADNVYEFGPGTTIAQNGTGVGSTGGFNVGGTHLRFGDDSGERYCIFKPYDTRSISTLRIFAIRGNDSNGGETPDIVGDEDLKVQYQVVANPSDAPDAGSWTELGIVIDAVPNGTGTGVLDNYDIALPEAAQGEYVYIRLQQDSNSGPNNDHYGILSVSFIEALIGDPNGPRYSNKQVILTTNPLETGSPTPAEARLVLGKRIDRLEVVDGGEGFATVDPNQTEVYIKTLPSQGQIDDLLASVTLGKATTFDIVDGGYGYDSTVPPTVVVSPPTADTDLPTARASYDENGSLLTLEIERQGSFDWTVVGVDLTHRTVGENNLTTKCGRDIGYLLDAVLYSLRFGGNQKLVEFAELYFVGSTLNYIVGEFVETKKIYEKVLTELCVLAMRQQLLGSVPYTSIAPVLDAEVISDGLEPNNCASVESALNTYYDIIETIFNSGPNVLDITSQNPTRSGFFTSLVTTVNYDIIPDPQLISAECADVVSSLATYASTIESTMISGSVTTRTLPDYIDNETTEFELYWDDDGSPVALTESDEYLLVALNGVIQRPKYNPDQPAFDSYWVDNTVVPNIIKFTGAPIWDQDLSAKTIQEPSQVEKVFLTNIGNYKRYTIDPSLIDGQRKGPFLMVSVEGERILNIDDPEYLIVLVNGVIQNPGSSYTIAGASITFTYPMRDEDVVDIRLCYGRDLEPAVKFHDFELDGYAYTQLLELTGTDVASSFNGFIVNADYSLTTNEKLYAYQTDANGSYPLGKVYAWKIADPNTLILGLHTSVVEFDPTRETYIETIGAFTKTTYNFGVVNGTLTRRFDYLSKTNRTYRALDVKKSEDLVQRKGFFRLLPGDKIKIDGESKYRTIRQLPDKVYTKDHRLNENATNEIYAQFNVSPYNGKTLGEGLSVSAVIENGSVVSLEWNERIVSEIVKDGVTTYKFYRPTAFNYETTPQLEFIPVNENGGGARAQIIVERGYIMGVQLIAGGSGYTEAPRVIVTRKYDIIKSDDIKTSVVKLGVQSVVSKGIVVISQVDIIQLPPPEQALLTAVVLDSVQEIQDDITENIWPEPKDARMDEEVILPPPILFIEPAQTEVRQAETAEREIQSIVTLQSANVVTFSERITQTNSEYRVIERRIQRELDNANLDSVIYRAPGAVLQAPLDIGDHIVYIADTAQFTSHGKLMVGDEVVYYPRKRDDRFLNVTRGYEDTTEKNWAPGTFIRQIPDYVSVTFAGVAGITTEDIVTLRIPTGVLERETERQVVTPTVTHPEIEEDHIEHISQLQVWNENRSIVTLTSTSFAVQRTVPAGGNAIVSDFTNFRPVATVAESVVNVTVDQPISRFSHVERDMVTAVTLFTPPGGFIDSQFEALFWTDPIPTRAGQVDLIDKNVVLRDLTEIEVRNTLDTDDSGYIGKYLTGNLGANIGSWDYVSKDAGAMAVSDFTLEQWDMLYPSFRISDLTDRAHTNYLPTGERFILGIPTTNNPVAVYRDTTDDFGTHGYLDFAPIQGELTIRVYDNISYFPDTGYLFFRGPSGQFSLCQYGTKDNAAKTFTDITYVRGNAVTLPPDTTTVIPYTIS